MSSNYICIFHSLTYRPLALPARLKAGGHHVGAADSLDLFEDAELGLREKLERRYIVLLYWAVGEQHLDIFDNSTFAFAQFETSPQAMMNIKLSHLVKVTDDFVEKSETLEALLVDVVLVVELLVVGDLGEHDGDVFVALTVQFLQDRYQRRCAAMMIRQN